MPPKLTALAFLLVASSLTAGVAGGQCVAVEQSSLRAPDGATFDGFGRSISLDGDRLLITADADDNVGSAYVYRRDGASWTPEQKLVASDPEFLDLFGNSGSVSGDSILLTNPLDDDLGSNSGSIYLFDHDGVTWTETGKLLAPDGGENDTFGDAMARVADLLVVAAPRDDDAGDDAGAIYVFRFDGSRWVEEQKLTVPGTAGDQVGWSVATDGAVIVATTVNDDDLATDAGAAYVFRYDGAAWVEEQKLVPSDGGDTDWFGWSSTVEGDRIVIGAYQPGEEPGAAYVFGYDGSWNETQKLQPSDAAPFATFGSSLRLVGDRLVVGSAGANDGAGALYHFHDDGSRWVEVDHWVASDAPGSGFLDNLGLSVEFDGATVVGGALFADGVSQSDAGAVYLFAATDLALVTDRDTVPAGGSLGFRVCGGLTGESLDLYARPVGGARSFRVDGGIFDADGRFSTSLTVPLGGAGREVQFVARGVWRPGETGRSNPVQVSIE